MRHSWNSQQDPKTLPPPTGEVQAAIGMDWHREGRDSFSRNPDFPAFSSVGNWLMNLSILRNNSRRIEGTYVI